MAGNTKYLASANGNGNGVMAAKYQCSNGWLISE
jgi:hypothetical protein